MARKNPHIGSSFESWLEDAGIREEATAAAIKAVIARQLASEMKKKKITKQRMAELMKPAARKSTACSTLTTGAPQLRAFSALRKLSGRAATTVGLMRTGNAERSVSAEVP